MNASIANKTQDVANQTDEIAKIVIQSADEKEFEGKESVKAKIFSAKKIEKNEEVLEVKTFEKRAPNSRLKGQKPKNQMTFEGNEEDDVWESF